MTRKGTKTHEIGGEHGATCNELLALINEYVDGTIDPGVCRDLEAHLAGCNPCRVVVDNVRKTIRLYRQDKPCPLPVNFRKHLHATLRKSWTTPGAGKKTARES